MKEAREAVEGVVVEVEVVDKEVRDLDCRMGQRMGSRQDLELRMLACILHCSERHTST